LQLEACFAQAFAQGILHDLIGMVIVRLWAGAQEPHSSSCVTARRASHAGQDAMVPAAAARRQPPFTN
jgi:hypothetical protein